MRMKNMILSLLVVLLAMPAVASADVAIIVNRDNANPVDEQFAAKAFLGNVARWPSRGPVKVVELPDDNPSSVALFAKLLRKSPAAVRDIWAANYFTGKSSPPKEAASDAEVKRLVAADKNAIGYINAAAVDSSVKAVLTIK